MSPLSLILLKNTLCPKAIVLKELEDIFKTCYVRVPDCVSGADVIGLCQLLDCHVSGGRGSSETHVGRHLGRTYRHIGRRDAWLRQKFNSDLHRNEGKHDKSRNVNDTWIAEGFNFGIREECSPRHGLPVLYHYVILQELLRGERVPAATGTI